MREKDLQNGEYEIILLPVFKQYGIEEIDGKRYVFGGIEELTYYNPLENPWYTIHEFMKIQVENKEPDIPQLLKFCNRYGLPGYGGTFIDGQKVLYEYNCFHNRKDGRYGSADFIFEDKDLSKLMKKYGKVTSNRITSNGIFAQSLISIYLLIVLLKACFEDYDKLEIEKEGAIYRNCEDTIPQRELVYRISRHISSFLKGVNLGVSFKYSTLLYNAHFATEYRLKELRQAWGISLYETMTRNLQMKQCKYEKCRKWFISKRTNQEYCCPACRNRANVAKTTKKKKEKKSR